MVAEEIAGGEAAADDRHAERFEGVLSRKCVGETIRAYREHVLYAINQNTSVRLVDLAL